MDVGVVCTATPFLITIGCKIRGILENFGNMIGTDIFLIGPKGAEKMEIKDFNLHSEIMTRTSFYVQSVPKKLGFVL